MKIQHKLFSILIIISLAFPIVSLSQEGDVYVSLAGGVSLPLSDYAATDFEDESSGFAKTGGNFAINFGYRLNEYISLTGLLSGSVNRYDYVALQNWLTEEFASSLPETSWMVQSNNWGLGGLMIGVTGSLPIAPNKLYLDVRALGGFTYVHSPEIKATGVEEGEEDLFIIISDHNTLSWALDFGAGFRYNRSRKQYFTLYADYLMANPQYDSMEYNSSVGPERLDSFSQRVSAVNITLGIGYIVN